MEETDIKPQANKQHKSIKVLKWFCGIVMGIILSISATLYFFQDHICKLVLDEVNKNAYKKLEAGLVLTTCWLYKKPRDLSMRLGWLTHGQCAQPLHNLVGIHVTAGS